VYKPVFISIPPQTTSCLLYLVLGAAYVFLNDSGSALEQYKILKSLDTELANELFNIMMFE
jgi:hypothetical protein